MKNSLYVIVTLLGLASAPVLAVQTPGAAEPTATSSVDKPMMLPLRDGGVLFGRIEDHSPDELVFARIDTGGVLSLPWGLLDPAKERELKLGYGYIEADVTEELVSADRLYLIDGTQLIGVIVSRDQDSLIVKNSLALITLPVESIVGSSVLVQVPASDIYTKEERYQSKLKEFADPLASSTPRTVAEAHLAIAKWCECIRDYAHAYEHYTDVALADPTWPLNELQVALERAKTKADAQEQVDYLGDIERLTRRGNFDKALDMLGKFQALYPNTPLLEDWNDQRERTEKAQHKALSEEVAKRWYAHAAAQARVAARFDTYEQVMNFLDEGMGDAILKGVTEDLQGIRETIQPEEVEILFSERSGNRWHKASYGFATWLFGEDRALAGVESAAEEEQGEQDAARDAIAEKVKRYIENQEAVRSASGGDEGESPADFWSTYAVNSRANFILAYYVEYSGVMELRRAQLSNCRECGGTGVREILNLGGAIAGSTSSIRLVECPVCHGIGATRRVTYR